MYIQPAEGGSIMKLKENLVLTIFLCTLLVGQTPATLLSADTHQYPRGTTPSTSSSSSPSSTSSSSQAPKRSPQTTPKRHDPPRLHDDVFREFEANLLRIFGMKERPKLGSRPVIPKYMRDLYNKQNLNQDTDLPTNGRGYLPANTVRSFYHQAENPNNCDEENGWSLSFNVSNIIDEEILTAADLRIFLDSSKFNQDIFMADADFSNFSAIQYSNCNMGSNLNETKNGCRKKLSLRIEVREIISPTDRRRSGECITRLLDTKVVQSSLRKPSLWLVFDVHPAVHRWRRSPESNHGLSIRIYTTSRIPIPLEAHHHLRLRREASVEHDDWHNSRPLLITYSDDGRGEPVSSSRKKRSAKHRRERGKKKGRRSRKTQRRRKASLQCRRHPMYVSFSEVGWMEWIVAPSGYQAFFCEGKCLFPISDYLNTTNHAIVQTLVNSVMPSKIPRACCVPTELSPISMLYVDEQEKVVLKTYQDMIVNACGCR